PILRRDALVNCRQDGVTPMVSVERRPQFCLALAACATALSGSAQGVQRAGVQGVERGKPMHRRRLKRQKLLEQQGICPVCRKPLPESYAVLDRIEAMAGYTAENTQLIHQECDTAVQRLRRTLKRSVVVVRLVTAHERIPAAARRARYSFLGHFDVPPALPHFAFLIRSFVEAKGRLEPAFERLASQTVRDDPFYYDLSTRLLPLQELRVRLESNHVIALLARNKRLQLLFPPS